MFDKSVVLPVRRQAEWYDGMLKTRLEEILPEAMRRADLDMWLILCQEDDYDPIFNTMIRYRTWAPILQMLIFIRNADDGSVRRINLSMTDLEGLYERPWKGTDPSEQWKLLGELVQQVNPRRIGINIGEVQWMAGGLTHNLHRQLLQALPEEYHARLVSAEEAAVYWGMTLCKEEIDAYSHVITLTKDIIADCYRDKKIIAGLTTLDDLRWNFWQDVSDCGLQNSFVPFFVVVRYDRISRVRPIFDGVILPGDVIHCDVGLRYLGLCSDLQEWAYVRRPGEKMVPEGLQRMFTRINILQTIFMSEFKQGLDGNTLLNNILTHARNDGIPSPRVYSHSLGRFLHEPGPLIGLPWEQKHNPGRGDVKLDYNSVFTMELSVTDAIPEWDGEVLTMSEEQDVCFTEQRGCFPLAPLQTEFFMI
ncbi:MAG: M24 family metallopeptidase [Anaerolineaceae bacterium]